jgi:hypothetical protein
MSVVIRVDPDLLRQHAGRITVLADELRLVEQGVTAAAESAPSYDGQFGPQVSSSGLELAGQARSLADRLQAYADQLALKADEFEQADLAGQDDIAAIGTPTNLPADLAGMMDELPWWIWLVLGIVPFGDAVGLLEELVNFLGGQGVSQLNLWLSLFGLAADAGWVDLFIPDPVDGVNIGLAAIKAAVRTLGRLPPSAEKIILEALQAAVKNPDEIGRVARILTTMAQHGGVARRIIADDDALRALLRSNNAAELLEGFARNGDEFLGRINPAQAARVSDLAQKYGVNIHIAGKLADTQAEAALRRQLAEQAEALARAENIPLVEAQLRVAEQSGVAFYQVKISSPGDVIKDVDAFVDMDEWASLTKAQQDEVREALASAFNVKPSEVDFYQELDALDPVAAGLPAGRYDIPNPQHAVPPSSVRFGPDGTIGHPPLGNLGTVP